MRNPCSGWWSPMAPNGCSLFSRLSWILVKVCLLGSVLILWSVWSPFIYIFTSFDNLGSLIQRLFNTLWGSELSALFSSHRWQQICISAFRLFALTSRFLSVCLGEHWLGLFELWLLSLTQLAGAWVCVFLVPYFPPWLPLVTSIYPLRCFMMLLVLRILVKAGMLLGSKSRAEHVRGTKFYLQNQKKRMQRRKRWGRRRGQEEGEKKSQLPL